ncbi:hypothetical protein [Paenibacillus harenae]|uniref:hypothetical protein n=1 Tax=Paenibacillus harenae TaxID=306543 RepID=UPI002790B2EB|nr:hypothetical protein [Paenibacillus harenae]MDQ0062788.1 hypothetical protein [Paenibacillus harenae]
MFQTWNWKQATPYAASKLIGSGVLYLATILILDGFRHVGHWPETAKVPHYWIFYYGYAPLFSILVDYLTRKTNPEDHIFIKIPLYLVGGTLPFVVLLGGFHLFSMVASLIGIACASIYYGVSSCAYRFNRLWPFSSVISVVMTVFLAVLVLL